MKYSKNERAEKIVGKRDLPDNAIILDEPCELGFHCPICEYEHVVNGNYDERLSWSEYSGFIWCSVCNLDIPSCFCVPGLNRKNRKKNMESYENYGLKDAIKVYLNCIEDAIAKSVEIKKDGGVQ